MKLHLDNSYLKIFILFFSIFIILLIFSLLNFPRFYRNLNQTYTSNRGNYSFNYPDGFSVYRSNLTGWDTPYSLAGPDDLQVFIGKTGHPDELNDYLTITHYSIYLEDANWIKSDISVNGINFDKYTPRPPLTVPLVYLIYNSRDDNNFTVTINNKPETVKTANQILSTFKLSD